MTPLEEKVHKYGKEILEKSERKNVVDADYITHKLMQLMMSSEDFRVASLRFTDVAPTLDEKSDFIEHMQAYFGDLSGLIGFLGENIPTSKLTSGLITKSTKKSIETLAKTFIASETIEDSVETITKLHNKGIASSIDILGEAVLTQEESDTFIHAYEEAIDTLSTSLATLSSTYPETDKIGHISRANVSIKLSALYPFIKPIAHEQSATELTKIFSSLLDNAIEHNVFINVDMEQYAYLPITLDVFERTLLSERYKNYPHIGIVCQAYLKESPNILKRLIKLARKRGTPFSIRLVKGAYWDYESAYAEQMHWHTPVFSEKEQTDANYEKLTQDLIDSYPHIRPCIASHNVRSLAHAIAYAEEKKLPKEALEFQMLYGMATPFRDAIRDMGFRIRQYCPIGEFIPGMSYLVRRLLENTANQSFLRQQSFDKKQTETLLEKPKFIETQKNSSTKTNHPIFNKFKNHPEKDFSKEEHRKIAQNALEKYKDNFPYTVGKQQGKPTLQQYCPWDTSITITLVAAHTKKDADTAIHKAKLAFPLWRDLGSKKRAQILHNAADLMIEQWDELFALQVYESGKDWAHADADICEAIDFIRFYAESAQHLETNMQPLSVWGESNQVIYEPKGVATVIAPWNFPLAISTGMTAAALATGNSVVYKPAEQTSAMGQKMVDILHKAGVPDDVLHLIVGKGETVGEALVSHKDTNIIAFTGSRDVGLHILEQAGKTQKGQQHTKKCVIEMGGKNAMIIDTSADLDEAVPALIHSAFGFQGQKCSACSRAIVIGSTYDKFIHRVKDLVTNMTFGEASNPFFDTSAVIDQDAFEKINHYIKIGKKDGRLWAQASNFRSNTPLREGYYIPPTVFTDIPFTSTLTREEIFGPVLCIYKAESLDEALAIAQDNEFALTGGLFSRNPRSIEKAVKEYRVGNLYINRGITGALVGRQPFGGGSLSGTGTKAGGLDYLYHFVEPRTITENTMRRGYAIKESS